MKEKECLKSPLNISKKFEDEQFGNLTKNYKELISSLEILFDFPRYLSFFIASKFDLSLPTTTKPIIPMPLCGVHQ